MLPCLADNSLHTAIDLLRWRAAVIHCELNKQEVGFVLQYVMLEPEYPKIGSGPSDRCVDLTDFGGWELLAQPVERLGPPAILGRDASAQVSDAHIRSRFQFGKNVRQAVTLVTFDGWD